MAELPIQISGVLYDKTGRTQQAVVLQGLASIPGLGVGGGPIYPDEKPPSGSPPGIWGGPIDPYPGHPLPPGGPGRPPGIWGGGNEPFPTPPIHIPPLPPDVEQPQPGDPTTVLPPPAGSAGWPVQPVAVPPYIVVQYPGVGPVIVAPPAPSA